MEKARLLQDMVQGRIRWDQVIGNVPRERMLEPGLDGGWSLKDVIAHVGEWENVAATRLEFGLGQRATGADFEGMEIDERNDRYYQRNVDRPLDAVLADEAASWQRLLAVTEALTGEQLNDGSALKLPSGHAPWDMIAGNAHEHFDEHIAQIHAWLGSKKG